MGLPWQMIGGVRKKLRHEMSWEMLRVRRLIKWPLVASLTIKITSDGD